MLRFSDGTEIIIFVKKHKLHAVEQFDLDMKRALRTDVSGDVKLYELWMRRKK